jgi:branched-chain amino acid transport system substrate-binding protein
MIQVILAAIEKSDGTRASITKQVFTAPGINIPADKSVLGKEIQINPETGDTTSKDITVEQMKSGSETFVQIQPVE